MTDALQSIADLVAAGLLPATVCGSLEPVAARYAIGVTADVAGLVDRADPRDPIARQFVPDAAELHAGPGETADPIGDAAFSPVDGLVHRYPDRVLLKLLHVCPVYCRFCFRREAVGPGGATHLDAAALDAAFAYIAARPEIWEVILTGGDPLILSPRRLADVAARLRTIPHVKILRLHSRVPCVLPARVDAALIETLRSSGKSVYVALHANHPRELTPAARAACSPPRRGRYSDDQPERFVTRHQRRRRDIERADARLRRSARKALLPASSRRGARHRPFPRADSKRAWRWCRRWPGARVRPLPTALCP